MKIKVPPRHNSAPAPQTIIIKERRRGCGCSGLVALALAVGIGFAVHSWYKSESRELEKRAAFTQARESANAPVAPSSAPLSRPVAAAKADVPSPSPAPNPSALPGWQYQSKRDEITDELTCFFALDGLRVEDGFIDYIPRLVIKAVPSSTSPLKYSVDVCVMIDTEGMRRNAQEVVYRFGSRPAVSATLQTSDNRHAVFLPPDALHSLDGCPTFVLRFTTTLGAVRTLRFTTQGFTIANFERELARQIRSSK